ncbi:hypothetical protein CGLO_04115 [Colletotrichum gloeosporioides Cg-14]|uniref:Uncharacterized protein n=1 Tax=Colletotrichum gloeosporioides (strain Cg-14) TaxID=1237896 RepID=T0M505_COLGC|nr:hypothetical protein CGLO_04115 [Colletotrichum gloeosporioides Cg-14]
MDLAMLKKHRSTLDERFICLATELAMLESPSMDNAIIGRSRYHVQDQVSKCPAPSSTLKGAIYDKEILCCQSRVNILSIQHSMIRLEKGEDPDDDPLWLDYVSGKARHEMTVLSDEGGSQKRDQSRLLMDEDVLPSAQDESLGQSIMQRKFGGQRIIQSDEASIQYAEGCVAIPLRATSAACLWISIPNFDRHSPVIFSENAGPTANSVWTGSKHSRKFFKEQAIRITLVR